MAVVGSVIKGKYELLKLLGKGGMSCVWLALDCHLNKQWAVKEVIKEDTPEGRAFLKSALKEADIIKNLDHPGIPRVVDIIEYSDVVYIIMDYIEGESLGRIVRERGPLSQDMAIRVAEDICDIFSYLHRESNGIIYRDLKPDNIMLTPDGNVRLVDFGIAVKKGFEDMDPVKLGSRGYAAPEQFAAGMKEDVRTDIYGFGATMYMLLTGITPGTDGEIKPLRYIKPELSAGLERIILKCLSEAPSDRYQSFDEVTYALWHYEEADENFRKGLRIKSGIFIGALVLSILCLCTGFVFLNKYIDKRDNTYENCLIKASQDTSFEQKIIEYGNAVELLPGDARAYEQLIGDIKADVVFDTGEETVLRELFNENIDALKSNGTFSMVSYEIGHLYWYYYDYGSENNEDNALVRMKAALPWMKNAYGAMGEDFDPRIKKLCGIYIDIAEFNTEINLMVEEASDVGVYADYFEALTLVNNELGEDDSELLNLEICEMTLNAITLYERKFVNDLVAQEDVDALYERAIARALSITPTTDKTTELWNRIMENAAERKN